MILIHQGCVKNFSDKSLLSTDIEIDGQIKNVIVSVESDYGKFLSPERADYALVGMLAYALKNKHDIVCETSVTEELLYNIREILIPTFIYNDSRNYPVKIYADIASPLEKVSFAENRIGVGTGLSCGVDSFYSVLKHLDSEYPCQNLTHISVFNIGSINHCYGKENIPYIKKKVWEHTEKVVGELNLPLIKLDSNFQDVIPQSHYLCHTYMDALAIYSLQKLWRTYYYAGSHAFNEFSLRNNFSIAPGYFEPFLLNCFSTSHIKIVSDGCVGDRIDKINFIADYPIARKNLHVCTRQAFNCGVCPKCLRTLLALDALNKLESFREVFDIETYLKNRVKNYLFLFQKYVLEKDTFFERTFKILYKRHKKFFDSIVVKKK